MSGRLARITGRLRVRLGAMLFGGIVLVGLGFYGMLVTLTRQWLVQELEARGRTLTGLLAARVATPLLLEDRVELEEQLGPARLEPDVLGAAVYRADGALVAEEVRSAARWAGLPWRRGEAPMDSVTLTTHQVGGTTVFEIVAPVHRAAGAAHPALEEAGELAGAAPRAAARDGRQHVGWVRVLVSSARLETAVGGTARVGLTLMLAAFALWLVPISTLVRITVRPLQEAGQLAREIAAGHLDRRLPVRTDDELGALASSLNSMAAELDEAQRRARAESENLRNTGEAVVAIARGARDAVDPRTTFAVVAPQVRRVAGCRGVALAAASEGDPVMRFVELDPEPPWGAIEKGAALDPELAARLERSGDAPLRLELEREDGALARGLVREGFRSALLVPLAHEAGSSAALLLAADHPEAFAPARADIVAGLATHLSSALRAARLGQSLERSVEELQAARTQLARTERLRVAGEMASGVAHEFNNVLAAILGRAQVLRKSAERGALDPRDLLRSLEVIERASRDGGESVRRLRRFADPDAARDSELVDLDAVARDAVELTRTRWHYQSRPGEGRIAVALDSRPGAWVRGHGSELRETFVNLILNAIDALPEGGHIRISTRVTDRRVRAVVEDDGIGMSEETRRRAFDPYFTTKGRHGTGLGLSMANGIVERHGGRIRLESEPGRGTRVHLGFPLASGPADAAAAPPAAERGAAAEPLEVMVVDDERAVRDLLVEMLVMLGHRGVACDGGETALSRFRPGAFDLVLTDLGMPGMSGWQVARSVRALDSGVALAFITGWGEEVGTAALREAGVDMVVSKPFGFEDVERLASLAALRRERRRAA
ncbi:MAG TPA: ATP-binding protein [Candidatus Eisenbacteria bacterium]